MTTCHHEQPPALAQDDYGALAYMLTFEEIDDAIDVLERIISAREEENRQMSQYIGAQGGVSINMTLHKAIDQLRAERGHRAIPEAVMDAAIEQLEGPTPDAAQDTQCNCDH